MTIKTGDRVPSATIFKMGADGGPEAVSTDDYFKGRKVVVFGLPGAFTRTCSAKHLPGFVAQAQAIRDRGVDEIACVSVNDAMVMTAWGMAHDAPGKVTMLSDGNCALTEAMGIASDMSAKGYGKRSKRYAMIVEDGVVTHFALETEPGLNVSSAEQVLAALG
jgi:peroxiredoxin